ncbi:hypothetical protein ABAC460_20190 [Asticcacaulis sp. AC460]|uniref:ATP-dependent helicase n=1 Tax=Asticcacaulis sp. AC460 TaxID=1282360 RepID=UPI0003C3F374|nr:UvrD-helicase domain-containing protein [Asticcacaulis sp. AC460]ESQ87346.1 hypothetical protein ABAC460_20190 [Asticcacaulis sp. AC460]
MTVIASDVKVAAALRSSEPLVVIEAPAGCGKTHQAADYCRDVAPQLGNRRVLVLTHTHAARSEIASRTASQGGRVEIRTIHSFITEVATGYHLALDLPADVAEWARSNPGGFDEVARRTRRLLEQSPKIAKALALRYAVIVCDEHQDTSEDQNAIIFCLHAQGSVLRIFGDPMQIIFADGPDKTDPQIQKIVDRWTKLRGQGRAEGLDHPHRWKKGSPALGAWILKARAALANGSLVDLPSPLPAGLTVLFAENTSNVPQKMLAMSLADRKPVGKRMTVDGGCLVLGVGKQNVRNISAFWGHQHPIWEGHTRDALEELVRSLKAAGGSPTKVGAAFLAFVYATTKGFTASSHGDAYAKELVDGCTKARKGKPAEIQMLAKIIMAQPDHKGVSACLLALKTLMQAEHVAVPDAKILLVREFNEAMRLCASDDIDRSFTVISQSRTHGSHRPPDRSISTVHKAKGLECKNVMVMLCDKASFANTAYKRRLLYVALSRPIETLTLVLCRKNPTPLLTGPGSIPP